MTSLPRSLVVLQANARKAMSTVLLVMSAGGGQRPEKILMIEIEKIEKLGKTELRVLHSIRLAAAAHRPPVPARFDCCG